MAEVNIFEVASKKKYRFPFKGMITVEDLWDLNLTDLDQIFKTLNSKVKESKEESLLSVKSEADKDLTNQIEIIKHIVLVKQEEIEKRKNAIARRQQKQKVMEVLASKEEESLYSMSKKELEDMLKNLEEE